MNKKENAVISARTLGRTSLTVSEIGHGLWGMGSWSGSDDDVSFKALKQSEDEGCSFYDSAWAYGDGHSDALLGRLLASANGKALVAASKVPPANMKFPATSSDAYSDVYPRDYVMQMTEKIRTSLGVATVPLLQLHVWDDAWLEDPDFESTVNELKTRHLAAHFGLSLNRWEPWNGVRAVRSGLIDTVQVIYNIFDQAPEDVLFPECRANDVGVIARVPLDEGSLGGKLTGDIRFPESDWRSRYFGPENLPQTVERVESLKELLPPGMSLPELAIRFILSNPDVGTIIVGMRTPEHVSQNVACSSKGPLTQGLLDKLKGHRWDREVTPWAN